MPAYTLGKKATDAIERSTGRSVAELSHLDFNEELDLVDSLRGSRPVFARETNDSLMPRGNVLLANGKMLDASDVEAGLDEMLLFYEQH